MGIEPTRSAWKADVLPLNYARIGRDRDEILGGRCGGCCELAWGARRTRRATRRGLVGGTGFEPVKAMPSDLQSDPFGHSGILPWDPGSPTAQGAVAGTSDPVRTRERRRRRAALPSHRFGLVASERSGANSGTSAGASGGTRTHNHLITNQVLCQLSYAGFGSLATCRARRPGWTLQRFQRAEVARSRAGGRGRDGTDPAERCKGVFEDPGREPPGGAHGGRGPAGLNHS